MKPTFAAATACAVILGWAQSASAVLIKYSFSEPIGAFQYFQEGFINQSLTLAPGNGFSCSTGPTCSAIINIADKSITYTANNSRFPGTTQVASYAGFPDPIPFGSLGTFYGNGSKAFILTVSELPEPATWAMMLMGFGSMGYAMRRRRSFKTRTRFV